MTNTADYVFHNVPAQLNPLETFLDPFTSAELDEIVVGKGWRCMDLGAGGGSVTRMLAERVGPQGWVTAVDQDVHMVPSLPNVDIHTRDMSRDEPLPGEGGLDLIHARLLTHHLPNRREVVHRFAEALRPGGWLLLGEFIRTPPRALVMPDPVKGEIFTRVVTGFYDMMEAKGIHGYWGEEVHETMLEAGLTSVRTRWLAESWTGGEYGCKLLHNNIAQKRDAIVEMGVPAEDIDVFLNEIMGDPSVVIRSHQFLSIRGRRPE
ncbi:methyltransferase domain-containing protein [Streptosporangium sp. NPDC048865]|uniref:methyltransferase domain-containing protein n=1 Tax=Streptosporangium sp. NPDC048865 TaxID=3155766 RepID=UPI00342026C4